ncbi:hypothetical protein K7432_012349 [Basidiobolus ranarum]|uniref:Uncharacterized protein n=1 Tax=Basidiobolus ranarum TaxID=34480 RepID=A0ABR2VSE2_9FUNG
MASNTQSNRGQNAQLQAEPSTDYKRAAQCLMQAFKNESWVQLKMNNYAKKFGVVTLKH